MKRTYFVGIFFCLTTTFSLSQTNPVSSPVSASQANPKTQTKILETYGRLPLSFEANHGQTDAQVKFLSRTGVYTLFLTADEAVLTVSGKKSSTNERKIVGTAHTLPAGTAEPKAGGVLRMKLRNANPAAKVTGVDELAGTSNYFIGNDPAKWHTNVPTYAKVKYEGIYSGIDLVYYGNQRQLEYDFVVAPGADPHRIGFDVRGAKRVRLDERGELVFKLGEDEICWHKPVVYQEKSGLRQEIVAHYTITDTNRVGFELAKYDVSRPLYIDPLIYSTYLGGSGGERGNGIAMDNAGNAYVTGWTSSTNFPTMNPLQTMNGGGSDDAFVAKINPSGSALVYSTYLGGSGNEDGSSVAVDSSGNAYVTGATSSTNFPTTPGAFQTTCNGGCSGGTVDAFVTEINASGSALVYSTYLGGSNLDGGLAISVDSAGDAYVTGQTNSTDFPTVNPLQPTYGGGEYDAFVTELNPTGSALVYSTYLGGSNSDYCHGIAVDSAGNAYVTGVTFSTDFPTMNPLQPSYGGGGDAFVAKLSSTGSALVYSTYLGGSGGEQGFGIAVDSSGNAYLTGQTNSTDFPTMNPLQPMNGGNTDAFVAKLNSEGSALVYSTYLGGSGNDDGNGIALDTAGNAYLIGDTSSTDFPTVNALQPAFGGGGSDAFVSELNPTGTALVYSTYLGGSVFDVADGVAVDNLGNAFITGYTSSTNFPTMNPLQPSNGGGSIDAFVAKIAPPSPSVTIVPPNLSFGNQTVGITSSSMVSTLTNTGNATLMITAIGVTGSDSTEFSETNTCGSSVPAGGSCKITVTFTPTATGTQTASVTITDNAPNSPQALPLSGVGVLPTVTISPTSLSFPTQVVYTSSKAQKVTLTNTGLGILTISSVAASGQFSQTNTCGSTLKSKAKCTVRVTFSPITIGSLTGSVSVTDNAPDSPQAVTLNGTGTYIQLKPKSLNFGNQPIGTRSLPKRITLTNKGSVRVNIMGISITGANPGDFAQTNNCSATVASGASCFFKVTFTPTAQGSRNAQVSVSDDGGGSPQQVVLVGTGTP